MKSNIRICVKGDRPANDRFEWQGMVDNYKYFCDLFVKNEHLITLSPPSVLTIRYRLVLAGNVWKTSILHLFLKSFHKSIQQHIIKQTNVRQKGNDGAGQQRVIQFVELSQGVLE